VDVGVTQTWTFIHSFFPFLQGPLQRIINQWIQFIRVRLDESKVKNTIGTRVRLILLLALRGLVSEFAFIIFDVFQGFLEVILATLPVVAFLFDELKSTEPETAILVRLAEETNGLAFST